MGKTIDQKIIEDLDRAPTWLKIKIAIWLFWVVYMPKLPLPVPVHFSITASLFMFFLLTFLPHHPMMIPTAIGGGLAGGLLIVGRRNVAQEKTISNS